MARGQSLTQEQIQQLLFPTSYSDAEEEDFNLGIDDDYIQPIDCSSSDTDDKIEEIKPLNCLSNTTIAFSNVLFRFRRRRF